MTYQTPAGSVSGYAFNSPVISVEKYGSPQITTPPSTAGVSGVALAIQPVITINNPLGAPNLLYTGPVTVTIQGVGTLSGTTTVTAVAGVAIFAGLTITGSGVSQLIFSAPGYGTIVSANITIA